jgi:hypothetical protein
MTPTISFTFPDPAQAAQFFAAISEAFAKIAKGVSTTFAPAASTSDAAAQNMKEFFNTVPSLADAPTVPDAPEKRARRRTKADHQAPPAPAPEAKPDSLTELLSAPVPATTPGPAMSAAVTIEQLRAAGNALGKAKGGGAIAGVLASFKAGKYTEVPTAQWPELLAALTKAQQ